MSSNSYPSQSPIATGIAGRCPRCGEGKLFDGFLSIKKRCRACNLDFAFANAGDGPAIFIILIVGFIIGALFLYVELSYEPPYWVHAVLWTPTILILCFVLLRPFKGIMVALQYQNDAREGRIVESVENDD